jgi:uncharacterized protein YjiS (DUF1127 family)
MPAHSKAFPAKLHVLRLARTLVHVPARLLAAAALQRSRQGLRRLDDHLLKDIGLTRAEAAAEADRSVWDAPLHWRR